MNQSRSYYLRYIAARHNDKVTELMRADHNNIRLIYKIFLNTFFDRHIFRNLFLNLVFGR